MTRSIQQLYGFQLGASDGEIGHVKDLYFDDENWTIRYVVVDTGQWIPGRLVLISPHAFGDLYQDVRLLQVNLTRQQIEDGPAIESHKPVSRQYEAEYYRYYGLPTYWNEGGMWDVSGFPMTPEPLDPLPSTPDIESSESQRNDDPHLRSTKSLVGYPIQTGQGPIGHVTDFVMDDQKWTIDQLVIETGHWFSGKEIVISPGHISRISYEESKIFVDLTKESIQQAPDYHLPQDEAIDYPEESSGSN